MGMLIFGTGTFVGMFLGAFIISLLGMPQEADNVYDRLDRGENMAAPPHGYYGPPPAIISPTISGK